MTPFESAKLHELNPVQYKWRNKTEINYGLIAQAAQKVYPNIVSNNADTLSIDYIQIIPLLIREVQHLKQEIEKLKPHEPYA